MTTGGFAYQAFYCEENVWHLCQHASLGARVRSAVFVAGARGPCVMWGQRAARRPGAFLAWDYHVFLLVEDPWEIWDLDTTLGFPLAAPRYLVQSFRAGLPADFAPRFRVVPGAEYARALSSDRSHMRRPDGRFTRPPPPWPLIGAEGEPSNLARFCDMRAPFLGRVLSLGELTREVAGP